MAFIRNALRAMPRYTSRLASPRAALEQSEDDSTDRKKDDIQETGDGERRGKQRISHGSEEYVLTRSRIPVTLAHTHHSAHNPYQICTL